MSLCVIITIIINVTVCDHHNHHQCHCVWSSRSLSTGSGPESGTEQGSLIRRRRRGDNVSAFWDIFGKICDDAEYRGGRVWGWIVMSRCKKDGHMYLEDWNLDLWKYDFMDYSTFDPGRILADEGWCIICPHLCGAYIEESFLVEQFHILAVWCITYSYLHIIFPKSKSF